MLARPEPRAQHELVGLHRTRIRLDRFDPPVLASPRVHVRAVEHAHAAAREIVAQRAHQALRREMAIEREVHGAHDRHPHPGLQFRNVGGLQHLRGQAEAMRVLGGARFLLEAVLRVAQHQQALAHELEGVAPRRGPFLEAGATGEMQVPQHGRGTLHALGRRGAVQLPSPAEQVGGKTRLDVERAFRIPHPLEPELHDPGCGERNEVTRHHHARVGDRCTVAVGAAALEHGDLVTLACAVPRNGKAHHTAADDQDPLGHSRCSPIIPSRRCPSTADPRRRGSAWLPR